MSTSKLSTSLMLIMLFLAPSVAQKSGLKSINFQDLKLHMNFLASDEMEGRKTGDQALLVAARYLAAQAEHIGLKPVRAGTYMQYYTILERSCDFENSRITIRQGGEVAAELNQPFYVLPEVDDSLFGVEGEVVFAGYGINDETNQYNDFKNIDIAGKVVLIMNRAPMNEDGTEALFDQQKWNGRMNLSYKLPYIYSQDPKAVLMVYDPKSGYSSIEDAAPGYGKYMSRSMSLESEEEAKGIQWERPRTIMIHREVADRLLEGSGKTLDELQMDIDRTLEPQSFALENRSIRFDLVLTQNHMLVPNVFGLIEGSDPVLKEEVVMYLAHYDHLGTDGEGGVFNGADDNASGTVALIEIAEAFMNEKKRPARSIGILWVSAEEIGMFGSKYFAGHPLLPADQIAAVINLDMVGRTRTTEDVNSSRSNLTVTGGDTIKVIGGLQSSVLMKINRETMDGMGMIGNYQYNNTEHPQRYFFRSDHVNFARKDIPVLFYSTGTHNDYHTVSDVEERLDYDKFLKMTRFAFKLGYNVAQYNGPIEVDNPMSSW